MRQVSNWSEVEKHNQRTLNARVSFHTSAATFAVSTGPCINYRAEAGTKNKPDMFFLQAHKKSLKNGPQSRFEPEILSISVWSGPHLTPGDQKKTSFMLSPYELVSSFPPPPDSVFHLNFHPQTEGRELRIRSSRVGVYFLTISTRACKQTPSASI